MKLQDGKLKIDENGEEVKTNAGINVGLLNPPYSQKDKEELGATISKKKNKRLAKVIFGS